MALLTVIVWGVKTNNDSNAVCYIALRLAFTFKNGMWRDPQPYGELPASYYHYALHILIAFCGKFGS
jgi:hypothetical protein